MTTPSAPSDSPGNLAQEGERDQVVGILAAIPALAGRRFDGVRIEQMNSLTNRNWKVTAGSDGFVLRVAGRGTERYIDRRSEARNAALAASIGIAPDIVHCDPATGLMVTRLIADGQPLRADSLRDPDMLARSARLLRRLHGSHLPFAGEMRLFPMLDRYLQLISDPELLREFELTELRRRAEAARQALEREPIPLVPSHVDPVPDNFVAGRDGLFLIDWEYSAMAEPMWDLAGLALEGDLDKRQQQQLLEIYLEAVRPRDAARLELYKSSLPLLAAAWAVLQLVDGNPNGDFAAYARDRLARHRQLIEGADHEAALKELQG